MANKSMAWYVNNNDFEGAVERFCSTNATWKKRWFNTCEQIFLNCKEWSKKYVLDPIAQTIEKIINPKSNIIWNCENKKWKKGSELYYIIRMFDADGNRVYSKVGTTSKQTIEQRMKQHLKYYAKEGITSIQIDKVYLCDVEAEGFESWFRAVYIRKYKNTFKKNDRFLADFDEREFDIIKSSYENCLKLIGLEAN